MATSTPTKAADSTTKGDVKSPSTTAVDSTEKDDVKPPTLTAADIVAEFQSHWKYAKGTYHQRWKDAWSQTNNERIDYGYEGTADTFIPLTFSIIESTKANVIGGRPKITFLPTTDEQQADTSILDSAVDYIWDKGYYQARVVDWVDGALTYGSSMLMETWDSKLDIPVARYIPIKDFWIDPSASTIELAEQDGLPCGYRYLTTTDALKAREVVNPEFDDAKPEGPDNLRLTNLYDHKAIDKAGEFKGQQTDATDKNMWQGSTLGDDAKTKQCEVIVRYCGNRKIEVINRQQIILDTESEIEDMYPFAPLYDFKDPSLFYGRGHVDILKKRQEELNDVDNQDTDNMSFQLDSIKWVDPQYAHLIPEIVSGAGVVIPIPINMMGEMQRPAYNPKAQEKRTEIKEDMREAVGAGETLDAGGVVQPGKTATEINAEQMNAGKRFDVMIQQMETGGFQRLARLMFKFLQKYADKELLVRTVGSQGVQFMKFLKEDYPGDWDPKVQLDASAKTEQARNSAKQGAMFTQYAALPFINLMELTKLDMRKQYGLDDTEIEQLLSTPAQLGAPQPGDGSAPAPGAAPVPGAMPMPMGAAGPAPMPMGGPAGPGSPVPPIGLPSGAPMPGGPMPGGPQPDLNAGGLTGDVKESADLTKLYVAAAAAGDHQLLDQIVIRLGFEPSTVMPVAIAAKQHAMATKQIDTAVGIQKHQHAIETAQATQMAAQMAPAPPAAPPAAMAPAGPAEVPAQ